MGERRGAGRFGMLRTIFFLNFKETYKGTNMQDVFQIGHLSYLYTRICNARHPSPRPLIRTLLLLTRSNLLAPPTLLSVSRIEARFIDSIGTLRDWQERFLLSFWESVLESLLSVSMRALTYRKHEDVSVK